MKLKNIITGPIILALYLIAKILRWIFMQPFGVFLKAENWLNERLLETFNTED